MKPTLHPQYVQPEMLKGLFNIKPATFPAEPLDTTLPIYKQLPIPIPRRLWLGDWCVDLENDIGWLASHYHTQPKEGFIWIQEKHRLTLVNQPDLSSAVQVEYANGEKRMTSITPDQVKFFDRWLPPIGMFRNAARMVLGIEDIQVKWATDKRADLFWLLSIVRHPSPEQVFAEVDKK